MRCPKCGYISFDFLDECLKCKKNIKSTSEVLLGAVPNVSAPSFLKFRVEPEETDTAPADYLDDISPMDSGYLDGESDFLSDDIDFSDEEADEIELMNGNFEGSDTKKDMNASSFRGDDIQDGDIEVDLSQFEELSDPEEAGAEVDEDIFEISVPEELSDMSDLDPPALKVEADDLDDLDELDLNLDGGTPDPDLDNLNFDLALDDIVTEEAPAAEPVEETPLSLEDIDFSDVLSGMGEVKDDEPASADMDSDLDFDLDLGGLSIHKDV